jgi:Flp pilus assembly protein TadG
MLRRFISRQDGAALPITCLYLLVSIGTLALAIDLGHIFLLKCELQRTADAAALAGASRFVTPANGIAAGVSTASPDCARAITEAQAVAVQNYADGQLVSLTEVAINLGTWNGSAFTATGCSNPYQVNAVQAVVTKNTDLYFGSLITGNPTIRISASAIALTGQTGGLPPGYPTLPLAVDNDKLPSNGQKLVIHLNPTPGDDGCWHTFFWQNPAASLIRDLIDGTVPCPEIKVGDFIKTKEGVADSDLKALEKGLRDRNGTWDVVLPVIPADAHTGWAEVLGFAAFRMTLVESGGSDKRVELETLNNKLAPTSLPGGTTYYGLSSGAPRLAS